MCKKNAVLAGYNKTFYYICELIRHYKESKKIFKTLNDIGSSAPIDFGVFLFK